LAAKCQAKTGDGDMSNSDNMALVGVLSTQLLHQQFVAARPADVTNPDLRVDIDYEHRERVPA
jgi:asparagine synthase (glutamine-hydrolysing)